MYKETLKLHTTCPKHPKYSPSKGEGAIRGGCIYCNKLLDIFRDAQRLKRIQIEFKEEVSKYGTPRTPTKKGPTNPKPKASRVKKEKAKASSDDAS